MSGGGSGISPLLKYFGSLTRAALDRLYADGWTCQGLLRALPPIARLYALRLACAQDDVSMEVVESWKRPESRAAQTKHEHALHVLERLNLLERVQVAHDGDGVGDGLGGGGSGSSSKGGSWRLHCGFAKQLLDGLCIGGVLDAESEHGDGMTSGPGGGGDPLPTLAMLEQQSRSTWERVLQTVLAPPDEDVELAMRCDGATLQELLIEAELLCFAPPPDGAAEAADDSDGGPPPRFVMSSQAPRYLLMPTHAQVWCLVRAYMKLSAKGSAGTQHGVLTFLMRLGLLRLGRPYRMDAAGLDDAQRATLVDMALVGLVYRPPEAPELYYATPLCQALLSTSAGASASGAAAATAGGGGDGGLRGAIGSEAGSGADEAESGGGFLVIETNFRLYAYTSSTLWARVLGSFTRIEYLLPNLIVGSLTRQSIHCAVDAGVTAPEIVQFLGRNAHPRMATQTPVLPETVVNQIQLWVKEKQRIQYTRACIYDDFAAVDECAAAEAYARDNKVLLWSKVTAEASTCVLAVRADAHEAMKRFLKARKASV